jgi:hypothetical protein
MLQEPAGEIDAWPYELNDSASALDLVGLTAIRDDSQPNPDPIGPRPKLGDEPERRLWLVWICESYMPTIASGSPDNRTRAVFGKELVYEGVNAADALDLQSQVRFRGMSNDVARNECELSYHGGAIPREPRFASQRQGGVVRQYNIEA